jgi:hypothetical protein
MQAEAKSGGIAVVFPCHPGKREGGGVGGLVEAQCAEKRFFGPFSWRPFLLSSMSS